MFRRLLVANRGEIACRILRAARSLGLETVAVHSDPDAAAPHVRMADRAARLGPGPAGESYLSLAAVLAAAAETGADAVHPGYGFLAEDAAFAEACEAAGLVFIGPPASAIRAMADKGAARRLMARADVPCVPGFDEPDADDAALAQAAGRIGFPLLVKAAAGGGGRGMRLVEAAEGLPEALAAARAEARAGFGSDALILERALVGARHVEVQVFADARGTVVHLGERDCSVQRRHQKIVEEAPGPTVEPALRERLGAAAVAAARAIGYRGAGTVEFLLDADGAFHFLEMNTRLQVEHPVTEAVTGLDLVALQLRVAAGEPLPFAEAPAPRGHAIEARLYAEDPARDFLPCTGEVLAWAPPSGVGVRVDAGIEAGSAITPFYDPLLAKLIAHGPDRETARRRLIRALEETVCLGPATNRAFLLAVLRAGPFAAGEATTAFVGQAFPRGFPAPPPDRAALAVAAVLDFLDERDRWAAQAVALPAALHCWGSGGAIAAPRTLTPRGSDRPVALQVTARRGAPGRFVVETDAGQVPVTVAARGAGRARVAVDGRPLAVAWARHGERFELALGGREHTFRCGRARTGGGAGARADLDLVRAPTHGVIVDVLVGPDEPVEAGQRLLVLEAMKMQQSLRAPAAGVVRAIHTEAGRQVAAGAPLIALVPGDRAPAKEGT